MGGIVFAVLLITALVLIRLTLADAQPAELAESSSNLRLLQFGLHLVPFAGIAFLWFIGVIRDQLGDTEDRLFSSVFLGSGLLFLAMLFQGAVNATSLVRMVSGPNLDAGIWDFGRHSTTTLVTVYSMKMAAVFTATVSTVILRTAAVHRGLAFSGYAVALVLLLFAGNQQWVELVFPSWVLLLSVGILFSPRRSPEPA